MYIFNDCLIREGTESRYGCWEYQEVIREAPCTHGSNEVCEYVCAGVFVLCHLVSERC